MITERSIEEVKQSLQSYLEGLGCHVARGRCKCPVHQGDSKTTAYIDTQKGIIGGLSTLLHCPKCDRTWDVIGLHAELHSLDAKSDFARICEEVAASIGLQLQHEESADDNAFRYNKRTVTPPAPAPSMPSDPVSSIEILRSKARSYVDECAKHIEQAEAYLNSRCISIDTAKRFRLGFDAKTSRVVIPSGDSWCARSADPNCQKKDRHRKAPGLTPRGIAWDTLESGRICWVVEGEFDALSLIEAGQIAAGLGGKDAVPSFCKYLEGRPDFETNPPRLLLALDDDKAGYEARDALSKWLLQKGLSFAVATPWHDFACNGEKTDEGGFVVKDANDALKQMQLDVFRQSAEEEVGNFKDQKEVEAENYANSNLAGRLSSFWKAAQEANSAIKTGFKDIDHILGGGLRPGLYVFGAIPSLGKTALVLQIANTIAEAGVDVLYFSLEMPAADLAFRSMSRLTYLIDQKHALTQRELQFTPWNRLSPLLTDAQFYQDLAGQAFDKYARGAASRMWIHDSIGAITVEQIEAAIAKHKGVRGCSPVVVIDYLQILQSVDPRMTDKAALDYNALRLKQISNTYAVPMMIISSFNRASYSSEVGFESFKESGAVEYCADCLFGLQFKAALDAKNDNATASAEKKADAIKQAIKEAKAKPIREIEFVVLKNRMGNLTGDRGVFLNFNPKFNSFEGYDDSIPW